MVVFATVFVIMTFTVGSSFCSLALWTIHKSTALRESFGLICKFQMSTDLTLLCVTSVWSLLPAQFAPPDNSFIAITITYVAEICYHYSGAMHDLFAINRFIYIVFPTKQPAWRKATPKILFIAAIVTALHTIVMSILGEYFELYWSTCEISLILILDSITLSFIFFRKYRVHSKKAMNHRAETRLILQSFCQCIPTTTVNIIFFFVLPGTRTHELEIVFSSIWIVTNIIDAFVIILFHFPQAFAHHRKVKTSYVAAITRRGANVTDTSETSP